MISPPNEYPRRIHVSWSPLGSFGPTPNVPLHRMYFIDWDENVWQRDFGQYGRQLTTSSEITYENIYDHLTHTYRTLVYRGYLTE